MKKFIVSSGSITLFYLFILLPNSFPQDNLLYFCEDYVNGEEVNVSNKFTTGWITVMLDLRPIGKTIGASKVFITIEKLKMWMEIMQTS